MCLLVIQHQEAPKLGKEWLADFYSNNQDGVGVMYSDNGKLIVKKILPKNAKDFEDFYNNEVASKFCAFHLRMKTHGNIDLENCHPYEVLNSAEHGIDLWLMHNGILSTGNDADTTKSDTWHYINNYLVPMLSKNPEFAFTEEFKELIEKHIGNSNKFVLMDNHGRSQVINQHAGVNWGGLWLSNTYAWSAPYSIPATSKKKHWQSEIDELPKAKQQLSWASQSLSNQSLFDEEEAVYWQIEQELEDLTYYGYNRAYEVDRGLVENFIASMGIDSFFEVLEALRNGNMLERDFIKVMGCPQKAKQFINVEVIEDY